MMRGKWIAGETHCNISEDDHSSRAELSLKLLEFLDHLSLLLLSLSILSLEIYSLACDPQAFLGLAQIDPDP